VNRVLALVRRRRLLVGAGAAFALLAGVAGATPGAFGAYSATITNSTDTTTSATYFRCADALAVDRSAALFQWPLGDTTGTTAADSSGNGHTGSYQGTITTTTTGSLACPRDAGAAWSLNGASSWAYFPTQVTNPTTFTEEIWFKTSVAGGRLIGFGTGSTAASGQYDRHLYIDKNGAVVFGVYASAIKTVQTTSGSYANGAWHYAAGVLSPAGMSLYVDGALVLTNTAVTTAENDSGYWRVGYDALGGSWPNVSTAAFNGSLRYAAVYTSALSAAQVKTHYVAGSGS
jgi:hypothetical protein